jgi:UTP:GlnB (protein PII) uridylyltransferase
MSHPSTLSVHLSTEEACQKLPDNFDQMVISMLRCEQTSGQSVYQHGRSVHEHAVQLIDSLKGIEEPSFVWRFPSWFEDYKDQILESIHDAETLQLYTLYHDCGKPYCRVVDDDGKIRFPDHANVSQRIWLHVGGSEAIGRLIADDMVIHSATAEEIANKLETEWSIQDAVTLLLVSLAEIHSNAKLFGSMDSTSFKMKWKTVERRGRQIMKFLFPDLVKI